MAVYHNPNKYSENSSIFTDAEDDGTEETHFLSNTLFPRKPEVKIWSVKYLVTGINVLLFITSCTLFATWQYQSNWRLNAALRRANTYSPIFDMLDLEMRPQFVNGTYFPSKTSSIARQMPNPQADAVWHDWEMERAIPITADQIRAMGKDPSTAAKLEDSDWGLGNDAYVGTLDVFHQLHCLNSLRRIAYGEWYNVTGAMPHHATKLGEIHEIHINHCVDILMQALQCSGNVNLITMHWVEEQQFPFPDMSIKRQCINFDKLAEWRRNNGLDLDRYKERMRKKEGKVQQLPAPDGYYEYYETDKVNPNHLNGANPDKDFNL